MSFDLYIEEGQKALRAMNNYLEIAKRVKEIVLGFDPAARVYVFGSVVEKRYTAASDIDILVVTNLEKEEVYKLKARVNELVDAPVELHVIHPSKLPWYTRFVSKLVEV